VLPFISSEKRLEIYGVPVSRVLAAELRGAAGAPVQIVSDPEALPPRIAWVIDGRILERGGGKVVLEARLRDPAQGSAAGLVATRPLPLGQIDRLARDLARQLLPVLEAARGRQQAAAESTARLPAPAQGPASGSSAAGATAGTSSGRTPGTGAAPETGPRASNREPLLLVGHAGGQLAQAALPADPVVTSRAADLARRLGRRPLVVDVSGIASPAAVKSALAGASASHALLSQVLKIEFSWLGVLTARGRVRLVLVDASGSALYDAVIDTDTLVGSRGDRHEALLGFVARQAMEIAAPRLRTLLAR